MISRLYRGTLYHCRHTPRRHDFRYRVFMPLVNVRDLPELVDRVPLWSARRWAAARFQRRDFLGDPRVPLVDAIHDRIAEEYGPQQLGPIMLLANWRYFGFQANPIACYFCFDTAGRRLRFIVAEVTNTPWEERHSYVIPVTTDSGTVHTRFAKAMHVSPFNPMDMTYQWASTPPGEHLAIKLSNLQGGQRVFDATLTLEAEPFTPGNLARAILSFPWMTVKVMAGIYWQALRLWLKGVPLHPHPNRR